MSSLFYSTGVKVLEVAGGFLKNLSEASEKRAASATSAEGGKCLIGLYRLSGQ